VAAGKATVVVYPPAAHSQSEGDQHSTCVHKMDLGPFYLCSSPIDYNDGDMFVGM